MTRVEFETNMHVLYFRELRRVAFIVLLFRPPRLNIGCQSFVEIYRHSFWSNSGQSTYSTYSMHTVHVQYRTETNSSTNVSFRKIVLFVYNNRHLVVMLFADVCSALCIDFRWKSYKNRSSSQKHVFGVVVGAGEAFSYKFIFYSSLYVVCLSVCPLISLSIDVSLCLAVCAHVFLLCLSGTLFASKSVSLSVCFVLNCQHLSSCLCACVHVSMFVVCSV